MNAKERKSHVQKWEQSGQSKKAYSASAGIKYGTFISWFNKKLPSMKGSFKKLPIESSIKDDVVLPNELKIVLPNGVIVYSDQDLTIDLLKALKQL